MGENTAGRSRFFGRRRQANATGGRPVSHRVNVTAAEEGMLVRLAEAQHVTVARLLVESALASEAPVTSTQQRAAMAELFAVHRLLGNIANNVNQIAKVANTTGEIQGSLPATMDAVRRTARRIDEILDEVDPR